MRIGKRALFWQSRYAASRQGKRARKQTRKLRTYLACVIRDIERKVQPISESLAHLMSLAKQIHQQQRTDKNKLYSIHAPEVECIAKGKVHKRYEFGCKVVLVTTAMSNWIVGIKAVHGNPYDGTTLEQALMQMHTLTAIKPKQVYVDKGVRGKVYHPEGVDVFVAGLGKCTKSLKRKLRRRCAIEPIISHSNQDHALKCNYLQGKDGDRINALLVGCGFNLRKLMRFFQSAHVIYA